MWQWKSEIPPKTKLGHSKVLIFIVPILFVFTKLTLTNFSVSIQHHCIAWKLVEGLKKKKSYNEKLAW